MNYYLITFTNNSRWGQGATETMRVPGETMLHAIKHFVHTQDSVDAMISVVLEAN